VAVPARAGNITAIGGHIGHRIDPRSTPPNQVEHASKIYIAQRNHISSRRWCIDGNKDAIYIYIRGGRAIHNLLAALADNRVRRALGQLVGTRLIEATVGDLAVACRSG
jgi:hypothetical protein